MNNNLTRRISGYYKGLLYGGYKAYCGVIATPKRTNISYKFF